MYVLKSGFLLPLWRSSRTRLGAVRIRWTTKRASVGAQTSHRMKRGNRKSPSVHEKEDEAYDARCGVDRASGEAGGSQAKDEDEGAADQDRPPDTPVGHCLSAVVRADVFKRH